MEFENPRIPEGINVSPQRPLRDFLLLAAAAIGAFGAFILIVYFLGGTLARQMPFAWEKALADQFISSEGQAPDVSVELQALAERLSRHMDLPEDMAVTVHYLPDPMVNAFATLGGQVFVFRGLLEAMPNENALGMVLAHEIAHIKHRDPAGALGGGLLLQIVLALALGNADSIVESVILGSGSVVVRGYSRDAERDADQAALAALFAEYGHVDGALATFQTLSRVQSRQGISEPPEFLSTHPLTDDRLGAIEDLARDQGWPLEGPVTPLSPAIRNPGE